MTHDLDDNDKAEVCLRVLLDSYTMLGMVALLLLLAAVDNLVTFAQKRDVFICDFIAAVKICQASLHSMYQDPATCFSTDEFWAIQNLLDCSHEQIHLKWITDLNDSSAILVFVCQGEQIHAEHNLAPVDRIVWAALVSRVIRERRMHGSCGEVDPRAGPPLSGPERHECVGYHVPAILV